MLARSLAWIALAVSATAWANKNFEDKFPKIHSHTPKSATHPFKPAADRAAKPPYYFFGGNPPADALVIGDTHVPPPTSLGDEHTFTLTQQPTWPTTPTPLLSGARIRPEIGSPFYVLEQETRATSEQEFSIWEIRPGERTANRYSGSRIILKGKGMRIAQFALTGFEITSEKIMLDAVVLLDSHGRVFHAKLEAEGRDGGAALTQIPGTYSMLESGAEHWIHALTREGEVVSIGRDPSVSWRFRPSQYAPDTILSLHQKEASGALQIFSASHLADPALLNGARVLDVRQINSETWIVLKKGDSVQILQENHVGDIQFSDLSPYFQDQSDGNHTQILYANTQHANVRVGGHILRLTRSGVGPRLSLEILAPGFFSPGTMRGYGLNFGLGKELLVVQPRLADRGLVKRQDVHVRTEEPPRAVSASKIELSQGTVNWTKFFGLNRRGDPLEYPAPLHPIYGFIESLESGVACSRLLKKKEGK